VKPYLQQLPAELEEFSGLFACLGVQENFSKADFAAAVNMIYTKYGTTPLTDRDFAVTVTLIKQLEDTDLGGRTIYLPTTTKLLKPANECYFNDAEWLSAETLRNDIFVVAPEIPPSLAQFLGTLDFYIIL
jgi:hypothetical protein